MTTSTIHPAELAERRGQEHELLVLDVRTPAEFQTAHIQGSYNVPLSTLTEHRDEVSGHVDRDVVLVCRSGARAQQAHATLTAVVPSNLHVLHGGITAWQAAGHRVVQGVPRWDLERQVRLVAGSIVLGSVLSSTIVPGAKWVAAGIGGGLTFAALSNSCLMGMMLSKLPYNRAADPDPRQLIAQLAGR
ncbi:MAG: rhodanese-like domain-containing protein [Ornithinimicrobium sp.]